MTSARSHSPRSIARLATLLAWSVLIAAVASPAHAQTFPGSSLLAPTSKEDAPTIDLVLPFRLDPSYSSDAVPAERFIPLTVRIGPGNAGGFMTVEYAQDATQEAMTVVPFAATPDKSTPITIVGAFHPALERITISLYDGATKAVIRRSVFSTMPSKGERPLPISPTDGLGFIGMVGDLSLARAITTIRDRASSEDPEFNITTAQFSPMNLPSVWMAYDGLELLAVRSSDTRHIPMRTIAAIRQWVNAGGWLLLIVDDDAAQWRSWLPPGEAGNLLRLAEPLRGTVGQTLTDLLTRPHPEPDSDPDPDSETDADTDAEIAPDSADPIEPPTITRRTIALSERAQRDGWTGRWNANEGVLLAEGPVGLGMVTIVTVDPGRAFPAASNDRLADAWHEVIAGPLDRFATTNPSADDRGWGRFGRYASSGAGEPEQTALTSAIERIARIPPLGHGMFIMIAASVLALALLIGPVDAVVLKKLRLQHRSWLTAIGWIVLATIAAYSAPYLVRSGPTRVGRAVALDLIVDPAGGNTLARSSSGQAVGVTTIFAAQPLQSALAGIDERSWWRGVSAAMFMSSTKRSFPPLTTIQMLSTPDAGSAPPDGPVLGMGLWTFRAMMDQGPLRSPITASITRASESPDEGYAVRLWGVPQGLTIEWANLRMNPGQSWTLELTRDTHSVYAGRTTVRTDPSTDSPPRPPRWPRGIGMDDPFVAYSNTYARDLPGANRRTASIEGRLAGTGWAVIELFLTGETSAVRPADRTAENAWPIAGPILDINADHGIELTIRLLVPVDEATSDARLSPQDPPTLSDGDDQPREDSRD